MQAFAIAYLYFTMKKNLFLFLTIPLFFGGIFFIYQWNNGIEEKLDAASDTRSGKVLDTLTCVEDPFSKNPVSPSSERLCSTPKKTAIQPPPADTDESDHLIKTALLEKEKGSALYRIIKDQKNCEKGLTQKIATASNCLTIGKAYPVAINKLQFLANGGDMESEYFLAQLIVDSFFNSNPIDYSTLEIIDKKIQVDGPGWIDRALSLVNDSANQGYAPSINLRNSLAFE